MIKEFEAREVSWFGVVLRWWYGDEEEGTCSPTSESDSVKENIEEGNCPTSDKENIEKGRTVTSPSRTKNCVEVYEHDPTRENTKLLHYRGGKRMCRVTGLRANTSYTFTCQDSESTHTLTVRTGKSGQHDVRLISAIENHSAAEVKRICEAAPEVINIPDRTGISAVMWAAIRGYPSIIRLLSDYGANIHYRNPGGKTALMLGAYHGHSHVVGVLLELGADWAAMDNAGCTALHYTVERGHAEVVTALLDHGADPNGPDKRGYTPLLCLALGDRDEAEMTEFLLRRGADPNTLAPSGETVLMAAARTSKPEILQLLLDFGADVQRKTRHGYSALDMAIPLSLCYEILEPLFPPPSDEDEL